MSEVRDSEDGLNIDLPRKPAYSDVERQKLDDSLQDSIHAAEQVGNEHLAKVLRAELGCVRLDAE